jgi:hypothetical protein
MYIINCRLQVKYSKIRKITARQNHLTEVLSTKPETRQFYHNSHDVMLAQTTLN